VARAAAARQGLDLPAGAQRVGALEWSGTAIQLPSLGGLPIHHLGPAGLLCAGISPTSAKGFGGVCATGDAVAVYLWGGRWITRKAGADEQEDNLHEGSRGTRLSGKRGQPRLSALARSARRAVGGARPAHRGCGGGRLQFDHRLRVRRAEDLLPMPRHLAFDAAKGVFMAASPWLFGFARNGTRYWLPHVLMGSADVLAAITTETE
jgi:hypothetical protein